jgi:O-antigen ligase
VSHHPTFSMMIVMAIFLCYYLINSQTLTQKKIQYYAVILVGIFLFIFIHIYSVRSGLLALYILILWELIQFIFIKKQVKKAIMSLFILLSIGALTLALSPTVRNKITNTSQDLAVVKAKGSANNQSLASRLISYKNAIQIANESSILFGCGLGDIEDANNRIFETYYPEVEKKILPHNQYLFYYAAIGLIGLIGFIVTFYFPLTVKFLRQNTILSTNYILISSYFLVEAPLENQLGVGFSLFFLLLPMQEVIIRS